MKATAEYSDAIGTRAIPRRMAGGSMARILESIIAKH